MRTNFNATTNDRNDPRPAYAIELLEATKAFNMYLRKRYGAHYTLTHEHLLAGKYDEVILPYVDPITGDDKSLFIKPYLEFDLRGFIKKSAIDVYVPGKVNFIWERSYSFNHKSRPEFKIEPRFSEKYGVYVF